MSLDAIDDLWTKRDARARPQQATPPPVPPPAPAQAPERFYNSPAAATPLEFLEHGQDEDPDLYRGGPVAH